MDNYSGGVVLTNAGRDVMARLIAEGNPIEVTRVVYGAGVLPAGTDLHTVTEVIDPKLDMIPSSSKIIGNGTASITAVVDVEEVDPPGFAAKEAGIYVRYNGVELLYGYVYYGDKYEYIPSAGGPQMVSKILTLYIVVGSITEIKLTISGGLPIVTQDEFQAHLKECAKNPQYGDPFGDNIDSSAVKHIWADSGDGKLHKAPVPLLQKVVLGNDWTNIKTYNNRLTQLEREQANILLSRELWEIFPDLNFALAEDFINQDTIDKFACNVTSVVAGDDSIDTDSLQGIVPGAYYTISDGVQQEIVQIKSCTKSAGIYRIILIAPIKNTYTITNTTMYRTTSQITTGQAAGSGSKKNAVWSPSLIWRGVNASTEIILDMGTTMDNKDNFTIDGDISFTSDGAITLV